MSMINGVPARYDPSLLLSLANEIASVRSRDDMAARLREVFLPLFFGDFISLWMSGEKDGDPVNFFPVSIPTNKTSAHALPAEPPMPKALFADLLSKGPVSRLRFSAVEKLTGRTAYSEYWRRKKITQMLAGRLITNNDMRGVLCIYYSTETDLVNEKTRLLADYLSLAGTAIGNILFFERSQQLLQSARLYRKQQEEESSDLRGWERSATSASGMIGNSKEMMTVRRLIAQVGPSDATVLLTGETGTGKELAAESIHSESHRRDRNMIKLNCAALPAALIESELFGHEKGSFTGASSRRIGKFELAHGSTILLDEVGEIPLETQVKLLRVLQEKEIERIGGSKRIKVDVRVIAATNRNLEKEVAAGKFRSDLYYRLKVFPIALPPLRQRKEDIEALTLFFAGIYARKLGRKTLSVSAKAMKYMMNYPFPGNIRELEHIVQRTILLTSGNIIRKFHLPQEQEAMAEASRDFVIHPLHSVERDYILKVIKACGGRISGPHGAAVKLGLPATTLISRMERLGIKKRYAHRGK
ncbi:MAG TPA: sigma 54-interacting transcriptional regulator [Puia sp.]|nr:sigma 54-interacting transcriptional regulator [Puia sp.]